MRRRRLGWVLLLPALCACALWPLAATSSAGQSGAKLDYAPRQDFVGGESVRVSVLSDERGSVSASGNLEIGSAAKKAYGRDLWPIAGAEATVTPGSKAVLRMHVPKSVNGRARRALAAGKKAIIRVSVTVSGSKSGASKLVAVIKPAG
jgi:hypothetical protein